MTTVPTPLEFLERINAMLDAWRDGESEWRLSSRRALADVAEVVTEALTVLRAQQVRDAARAPGCECPFPRDECPMCDHQCAACAAASTAGHLPVLPAPVSPGVGPLVGDEGLRQKVAIAIRDADQRPDEAWQWWVDLAAAAICAVDAHLGARRSPLEAIQGNLWDRINEYTVACGGDPSKHVYGNTSRQRAVVEVNGVIEGALATVDTHLATRALRPAREVAHETCRQGECCTGIGRHNFFCDIATAAIERDRAGGRR